MVEFLAVHKCLFCPQTFDSATEKDDHILEHFDQETCGECEQNLIRIGRYLYTRHDEDTCIKRKTKLEEHIESCSIEQYVLGDKVIQILNISTSETITENQIRIKTEPNAIPYQQTVSQMNRTTSLEQLESIASVQYSEKSTLPSESIHLEELIIKTEPVDQQDNLLDINDLESMTPAHESEVMLSASANIADIDKRFSNVNLNPVVLLEDILQKTYTTRPSNQKVNPPALTNEAEVVDSKLEPEPDDKDEGVDTANDIDNDNDIASDTADEIVEVAKPEPVVNKPELNATPVFKEVRKAKPESSRSGHLIKKTKNLIDKHGHAVDYSGTLYVCKYCHRSFTRNDNKNTHEKSHEKGHEKKKFSCKVCNYHTNLKTHFGRHSKTPLHFRRVNKKSKI